VIREWVLFLAHTLYPHLVKTTLGKRGQYVATGLHRQPVFRNQNNAVRGNIADYFENMHFRGKCRLLKQVLHIAATEP
jgi:hypothetical protein